MYWSRRQHDGVTELVFSRPPRNMMSFAAMEELQGWLEGVGDDRSTNVVLLTSSTPDYFIAHGDLDDLIAIGRGQEPSGDQRVWGHTLALIEEMPQPVVAAINGQAWGGGCEIASACTIRLASEAAHFAQPEIDLGIIPGAGGTVRLAHHVGVGRAQEMILTGRRVDALEALAIGLVQAILPTDRFNEHALAWSKRLALKPGTSLIAGKESIYFSTHHPQAEALRNEARLFISLQQSEATLSRQQMVQDLYASHPPDVLIDLSALS
jgi:enoyl-CoA hydratase/carnithine racemase